MRRVGVEERRARLARRHHLATPAPAGAVVEVARSLLGFHATDPASVFLAAAARTAELTPADLERALYEDRSLVRMLGMRRTMFVVPTDLAGVVQAACTRSIEERERRRLVDQIEAGGLAADGAAWLAAVEASTLAALAARGEATAAELSTLVPGLREQFRFGQGRKWAGVQAASTRVLFVLAAAGRIVRGRPGGSWTSSQYRWATTETWLPDGMVEPGTDAARVELARGWLASYGPAGRDDLRWWTGWTAGQVQAALRALDAVEVDVDGATALVAADDEEPVASPPPWAALLPALDPTIMGWSSRLWYLGEHGPALFDRSGNAGPTAWLDGRVVGGWAQRRDGEIVVRLLEKVGRQGRAALESTAERLQAWIGPVRVTPRFRTPLERELSA
jgi:hypothetical protein